MARAGLFRHHLRHPVERVGLEPLGRAHEDRALAQQRRGALQHVPHAVRRHRGDDHRRIGQRRLERGGGGHGVAEPDRRKVAASSRACGQSRPSAPRSRPHRRTSCPTRPQWTASAVPQLPAPSTAMRSLTVLLRACRRFGGKRHAALGAGRDPPQVGAMAEQDQGAGADRRGEHGRRRARQPRDRGQRHRRGDRSERHDARDSHTVAKNTRRRQHRGATARAR